jgi:uncharacterized protein (DUF736 family)
MVAIASVCLRRTRSYASSKDGRLSTRGSGYRPDHLPATAASNFFPRLAILGFLAQAKKAGLFAVLRFALALRVRADRLPSPAPPSRPQSREPDSKRTKIMATIGTFTKNENGFTGAVKTLSLNVKAKFVPAENKENEKAPDFRILTGNVEFGAAWKKTAQNGRDYLSVRLDDPSFAAPIFANLVEGDIANDHSLIWSRRSAD